MLLRFIVERCLGDPYPRKAGYPLRPLPNKQAYWFCPYCKKKSFQVLPELKPKKDKWKCRDCGNWGDEHDLIKECYGIEDYSERQLLREDLWYSYLAAWRECMYFDPTSGKFEQCALTFRELWHVEIPYADIDAFIAEYGPYGERERTSFDWASFHNNPPHKLKKKLQVRQMVSDFNKKRRAGAKLAKKGSAT